MSLPTSNKKLLSKRITQMSESATIAMSQMARDLRSKGHDVISLSLGEPDFDTPQHIKDAAKKALDDGRTKYTPVPGLVELREAIKTKFKRDNDIECEINQIVVSNGAKQSLANLSLTMLDEGDEVIIFSPYWVSYYEIVKLGLGTPVILDAGIETDFKVTAAQLDDAITNRTKFILFSSPCNPTGSVYEAHELKAIADVVAKHDDVYIVADEIYEYINFTGKHVSIGSFENVKDRTITVNGFSKGFAMTGWRLGYICAPKEIAAACSKMQSQFTSGATAFGQVAAAHALLSDMTPTHEMRKAYRSRRDMLMEKLKEIPGFKVNQPEGAFYIFPDISALFGKKHGDTVINNSVDLCNYLLQTVHVALVPGAAFGNDNCLRISYAASDEQLKEAVRRVKKGVEQLT